MNIKKIFFATLVAFIVSFGLGGLFHFLLKDWYHLHLGAVGEIAIRKKPLMLYVAGGNLMLALIMSYLYPKGVESHNKIIEGLKFGVIIGILSLVPHELILYGASTLLSRQFILMDALLQIVQQGIAGICIAMVYGNEPYEVRKE